MWSPSRGTLPARVMWMRCDCRDCCFSYKRRAAWHLPPSCLLRFIVFPYATHALLHSPPASAAGSLDAPIEVHVRDRLPASGGEPLRASLWGQRT
jgi:hypothetical protein